MDELAGELETRASSGRSTAASSRPRNLTATRVLRSRSNAAKTCPIPPSPSFSASSKRPTSTVPGARRRCSAASIPLSCRRGVGSGRSSAATDRTALHERRGSCDFTARFALVDFEQQACTALLGMGDHGRCSRKGLTWPIKRCRVTLRANRGGAARRNAEGARGRGRNRVRRRSSGVPARAGGLRRARAGARPALRAARLSGAAGGARAAPRPRAVDVAAEPGSLGHPGSGGARQRAGRRLRRRLARLRERAPASTDEVFDERWPEAYGAKRRSRRTSTWRRT